MKLSEQIALLERDYKNGGISSLQQQITDTVQIIKQLNQGELKQLAIQLMQQQTLQLFYGLILQQTTIATLESFKLELRLINNIFYMKYKKSINQAIQTKLHENLWEHVSTFE